MSSAPAPAPEPEPEPNRPFNIAIVGGGLAGVALAIGLLRRGVDCQIYEKNDDFGELGAGMAFGPNAVQALRLISPHMLDAFKKHATFNHAFADAPVFMDYCQGWGVPVPADSTSRAPTSLLFRVGEKDGNYVNSRTHLPTRCCVHRAHYLNELVKLIPAGTAHFSKELTDIDDLSSDKEVHLTFSDGSTASASAVIGCDGLWSKTRECLFGDGERYQPEYTSAYAYRAMAPVDAFRAAFPGGGDRLVGQIFCGRDNYLITYPVDNGRMVNMSLIKRCVFGVKASGAGTQPVSNDQMAQDLADFPQEVVALFAAHGSTKRWPIFQMPPMKEYSSGRVCLIGDSAHCSSQHLGAGAGQAMEDAYVLCNLLSEADAEARNDLEKVFQLFNHLRNDRTQDVVRNSKQAGEMCCALEEILKDGGCEELERRLGLMYEFIWDIDLEATLWSAMDFMRDSEV